MPDISDQVIEANRAFYQAFSNADAKNMENLWSSKHEIAVIHPGWPPLHGRESVMSSWRQIMESTSKQTINCLDVKVCLQDNFAFVTCTEEFAQARLIATNIFVMEANDWKIVHHQAGPLAETSGHATTQSLH